MKKENKGITLIALVVTVIILLILASIAISQLTNNGLFTKTKEAREKTKNAQNLEDRILKEYENIINEKYIADVRNNEEFIKESELITNIDFSIEIFATKIILSINTNSPTNTAGYYIFLNNKVVKVSEENIIEINNLERNTDYKIKCAIIDKDGNIKISEEKNIKTLDRQILYDTNTKDNWYCSYGSDMTVNITNQYAFFSWTGNGNYATIVFRTKEKINLDTYTKLAVEISTGEDKPGGSKPGTYIKFDEEATTSPLLHADASLAFYNFNTNLSKETIYVDINSVTPKSTYVYFQPFIKNTYLYKMWLE